MEIERVMKIKTTDIQVGDRLHVDHYTATCQEITPKRALFLLDQYLDDTYEINASDTNVGGYAKSDLRETLRNKEILDVFKGIRDYMAPFENGDLIRIPFAGELFGNKLPKWCEPDGHKQWPLMQDVRNRLASRCGECEWGWLQNKVKTSSTNFCYVAANGLAGAWLASGVIGVRPAFLIAKWKDKEPALRDFDNHNPVVNSDRAYVLKNSGIYYGYH
jgi:hypothetical protein